MFVPGKFTFKAPASTVNALAIYNQSFADFLIGYATSFSQGTPDGNDLINAAMYEGYLQDNFKIGSHLTINAGLRYTFFREATNELLPIVNFDPALYNAGNAPTIDTNGNICAKSPCTGGATYKTYSATNGLLIAGSGGTYGRKTVSQPKLDLAPRFGFVYSPFAGRLWDLLPAPRCVGEPGQSGQHKSSIHPVHIRVEHVIRRA